MPTYTKFWLDWTNKKTFTVASFSSERFLVSVFLASDSDLELDAGMHKTKCATRNMMGNVGAPFSFHHKRILNLVMVSRFTGNAKLTHAHPCPPMPTQNPWAWMWAPNVGLWYLHNLCTPKICGIPSGLCFEILIIHTSEWFYGRCI
jgi:hypothetical protein